MSPNCLHIVFVDYQITICSVNFNQDGEELNNAGRDQAGWLPHTF
ncbi:hypothetical protein DIKCMJMK_03392 [Shewanella oneidensis]|nr:hypothetical protein [Shewanella oneidensis]